jgi:hypothetical protein
MIQCTQETAYSQSSDSTLIDNTTLDSLLTHAVAYQSCKDNVTQLETSLIIKNEALQMANSAIAKGIELDQKNKEIIKILKKDIRKLQRRKKWIIGGLSTATGLAAIYAIVVSVVKK